MLGLRIFDGKNERKNNLKDRGLYGKITAILLLRLTKQHDVKMYGVWRYSSTFSLSRQ
jgi:hypothetical protein